jgi:hypothetical protein
MWVWKVTVMMQIGEKWWSLQCSLVDTAGNPFNNSGHPEWAMCSANHLGPRAPPPPLLTSDLIRSMRN